MRCVRRRANLGAWCIVCLLSTPAAGLRAQEKSGTPGPPAVTQPAHKPSRHADLDELNVQPDHAGRISFSFRGQAWEDVLEWLADLSGMSLQMQEVPAGHLDLTTRGRYSVDETRDLINSVLLTRGFTLLCHRELLLVTKLQGLDNSLVPRVAPEELEERGTYELVKVLLDLEWLEAEAIAQEIKPLLGPHGDVTALKATNRLDVLDTAGNLRRIRDFLIEEQSHGQQRLVRKFKLNHIRASQALETLNALLNLESDAPPQVTPVPPAAQGAAARQAKQAALIAQRAAASGRRLPQRVSRSSSGDTPISLAIDQRENSVLVHAPPEKMVLIDQAIRVIDLPRTKPDSGPAGPRTLRVYRPNSVDAATVVRVLEELASLDPATWLEVDDRSQSILAYATVAEHDAVETLLNQLGAEAAARSRSKVEVMRLGVPLSTTQLQQLLTVLGQPTSAGQAPSGPQTSEKSPAVNKVGGPH